MKMLRKIIDGKSLETSQENVYEGVLEYVTKISCLKKQYFEKKVYGGPVYGNQVLRNCCYLKLRALSNTK